MKLVPVHGAVLGANSLGIWRFFGRVTQRGRRCGFLVIWVWGALAMGCGYRPAYGEERPGERLRVVATAHRSPEVDAVHAALAGMRAELSRAGVLEAGGGYPRVELELLRVDEVSGGVAAVDAGVGGSLSPLARGSVIGVVGRAWIVERAGGPRVRDTGDVRRVERYSSATDVGSDSIRYDEAVRVAARNLGQALARRILGEPEPILE